VRWRVRAATGPPDDGVVQHHSGRRHRNTRTKAFVEAVHTRGKPVSVTDHTVWSVVLIIIYYMGLGIARNLPKSINGKYRPIGLPERETEKNLNNSKPVPRRRR